MKVVIVGASLGGLRTAQALRQRGFEDAIVLAGREPHLPYDRPPLSKEVLTGAKEPDGTALATREQLEELGIELRLGVEAAGLDPDRRRVEIDGSPVGFDHLVVATGATPRRLPFGQGMTGVVALRDREDAAAIREVMDAGGRLVVVGAGFIGCEIASSCVARELSVTVLETFATPLQQSLGPGVGALVAEMHRAAGVDLRLGVAASQLVADRSGRVQQVLLSDGSSVPADLVVVGIGVAPETAWLESSGLDLADGLLCDSRLRSVDCPWIHGVGDVVRWHHPGLDRPVRVEHWTHATESASFVAGDILGDTAEYAPVAYVWSDQLGHRLQVLGLPAPDHGFRIVHRGKNGRWVGLFEAEGTLSGAAGLDHPGRLMRYRALVERRAPFSQALELAGQLGD